MLEIAAHRASLCSNCVDLLPHELYVAVAASERTRERVSRVLAHLPPWKPAGCALIGQERPRDISNLDVHDSEDSSVERGQCSGSEGKGVSSAAVPMPAPQYATEMSMIHSVLRRILLREATGVSLDIATMRRTCVASTSVICAPGVGVCGCRCLVAVSALAFGLGVHSSPKDGGECPGRWVGGYPYPAHSPFTQDLFASLTRSRALQSKRASCCGPEFIPRAAMSSATAFVGAGVAGTTQVRPRHCASLRAVASVRSRAGRSLKVGICAMAVPPINFAGQIPPFPNPNQGASGAARAIHIYARCDFHAPLRSRLNAAER